MILDFIVCLVLSVFSLLGVVACFGFALYLLKGK